MLSSALHVPVKVWFQLTVGSKGDDLVCVTGWTPIGSHIEYKVSIGYTCTTRISLVAAVTSEITLQTCLGGMEDRGVGGGKWRGCRGR